MSLTYCFMKALANFRSSSLEFYMANLQWNGEWVWRYFPMVVAHLPSQQHMGVWLHKVGSTWMSRTKVGDRRQKVLSRDAQPTAMLCHEGMHQWLDCIHTTLECIFHTKYWLFFTTRRSRSTLKLMFQAIVIDQWFEHCCSSGYFIYEFCAFYFLGLCCSLYLYLYEMILPTISEFI